MMKPKNILITGCSRGIGRAMVNSFIQGGDTVIACARDLKAINELTSQYPTPHFFQAVDVRDDSAVSSFAKTVLEQVGAPDLLINNAAIINRNAPLWEISANEFSDITAININGVANMIRHFVPAMIENGSGIIVNLSSGWGRSTAPDVAPYCATKFAIEGLSSALAEDLPTGMASIALSPGTVNTDMLRSTWEEGAYACPSPEEWAVTAIPYINHLSPKDNGRSLTTP